MNTLVKESEDRASDLVIILAGYQKEMTTFLNSNSGLSSRFPNTFQFADYSPEEMAGITRQPVAETGFGGVLVGLQSPSPRRSGYSIVLGRWTCRGAIFRIPPGSDWAGWGLNVVFFNLS